MAVLLYDLCALLAGQHFIVRQCHRLILKTPKEIREWHIKNLRKPIQTTRRKTVYTAFILLNLLEPNADFQSQLLLR